MSNNRSSIASKSSCYSKNTHTSFLSSHKSCKSHKSTPKKQISSRNLNCNCNETKSSTNVAASKRYPVKPKKTTKSEVTVPEKCKTNNSVDVCKKCGDVVERKQNNEEINKIITAMNVKSVRNDNSVKIKKKISKPIQQYYKNENFELSTDSAAQLDTDIKKTSLDTIKEVSELHAISQDSILMVYSDSDDDVTYLDPDDEENIEQLKQFRNKNYFECHSAKSRIKTRPSVTNLDDHKCVYRFYLNDRLFPVPLNTDYNNKIRCVECHLPMDIKRNSKDEKINGTIQAKVKLGKETQDMVLLLPIKESLIIEERRKEERKVDDEYVYFGVVKLSNEGNSSFNSTLPQDSLALKYQKGYKEFQFEERYKYENVQDDDVVVI